MPRPASSDKFGREYRHEPLGTAHAHRRRHIPCVRSVIGRLYQLPGRFRSRARVRVPDSGRRQNTQSPGRLCQVEDGRNLIYSPHVRKCAQTARGHWMPAVSPHLIEGDENWFRRQPYSRVRKPHTAAVSAALTPHIVQEPCSRVDDPPRSHRRPVPTRTTLPTHLRSVDSSARSFTSFQPVRLHPWPLDSRSAEGWVMRGAW